MGKDGQSSKSNKPSKSPKKKSASSKKPNTGTAVAASTAKSSKGGGAASSKAVNSKVASAKGGKSSKGSSGSGGGSSSYSQSKSAPSSKVSKGGKQRSPGGRKPAAPSAATKAHQKKSPKSVKSGKKSAAAAAASSSSAYSSATSDDSTAEVKAKAKNKQTSEQQQEEGGGAEYGTAEDKESSSTAYEAAEEEGGSEVESKVVKSKHKEKPAPPPPPPAEKPLEFTKPTINQMKKEKKEKPLSMAERITSREFEQLFDEINELNSGVQMLKHSYASIIKSLVAIQTRRGKKKSAKEVQKKVADATGGKVTFLTTLSTCNPNELRTKSCLENTDKYDLENFLNPGTRDETFQMLFDEIEDLTKRFEPMRPFYDDRGRFRRDVYDAQEDVKMDRAMYNEFKIWCKKLSDIVDDIARNYNDDLLNMFRLN